MTALLVITALLLLVSGLVKLHAAGRVGLGVTVLPLVEIVAGLGLLAPLMFAWRPAPRAGLFIVCGGVLLVLASSGWIGLSMARKRRSRDASEGARLATYVKYLSRQVPPES